MHLNGAVCHYILVQKIDGECRRIGTEGALSERIDFRDGQVRKVQVGRRNRRRRCAWCEGAVRIAKVSLNEFVLSGSESIGVADIGEPDASNLFAGF